MLPELLLQPAETMRLGDFLLANLRQGKWDNFRAAVAFVKQSGASHISPDLASFSKRGKVKISFGVSQQGTTLEGVRHLLDAINGRGELWVFHNRNGSTFHPKVYLFKNSTEALLAIGSGNLTEGGLFTNYEAGVVIALNLSKDPDKTLLSKIEATLDQWANPAQGLAYLVAPPVLARLLEDGLLVTEAQARQARTKQQSGESKGKDKPPFFGRVQVPGAPARQQKGGKPEAKAQKVDLPPHTPETGSKEISVFVMTLQKTDVGHGQTHAGTSRRSPEIFIPLCARNYSTGFWDWPVKFTADARKAGKMDRQGVNVRLGGSVYSVNMMTWPDKSDFRLRSEVLRSAGNIGDILRLEKVAGHAGFDYYAEIIPLGTAQHNTYLLFCNNSTPHSKKLWGYF